MYLFIIHTLRAKQSIYDLRDKPYSGNIFVRIMNMRQTGDHGARTLRRGLHILAALRRAPDGLDIVGIASALGMQRTSVYRYVSVLVEEGYAEYTGSAAA